MKRPQANIYMTMKKENGKKIKTKTTATNIHPNDQHTMPELEHEPSDETHEEANNISLPWQTRKNGTLYTNITGALPAMN